jgi:hypothetical protein
MSSRAGSPCHKKAAPAVVAQKCKRTGSPAACQSKQALGDRGGQKSQVSRQVRQVPREDEENQKSKFKSKKMWCRCATGRENEMIYDFQFTIFYLFGDNAEIFNNPQHRTGG